MKDNKIIFILLCLVCITISFNVAAIAAAIPAISKDIGFSDIVVSKIIPSYMIPYGLGALIYAPLTKHISYKWILFSSMLMYGIANFLCTINDSIMQFYFARAAMGISGASAIPLGLIIIGLIFEKQFRGRMVGLFFSCSFFASIIGIILSGLVNWRWLFYVPGVFGVMTSILILLSQSEVLKRIGSKSVNYFNTLNVHEIRKVFLFIFAISFFYHGVHKWFGVYLSRVYQMDMFLISLLFILIAVSSASGQLLGGYVSDKKGRYISCLIGILVLSLSTMLLIRQYPIFILAFILAAISIGWTIGHNGVSTVLTDFPDDNRAEIASLNSSVRFISGGLGFIISGLFIESNFGLTFFCLGVLMLSLSFLLRKIVPE